MTVFSPMPLALIALALAAAATPAAAQQGDVKAGVDAWSSGDYEAAVGQWKAPAERGDADAQFNLAQAYKLGRGVPADLARAEDLYARAAKQGHPQAADNYGLALFEGGKKAEAVRWLDQSAARGEPRAQFVLGTMHFNGDHVAKDWPRAYALVSRAASTGLPQASRTLTQMDRYIPAAEKQAGIALARRWEGGEALAPSHVATAATSPVPKPPAATGPATPTPTPTPVPTPAKPAAAAAARAPAPAPAAQVRDGGWRVQLGAFAAPGNARALWSRLSGRFPGRSPAYVAAGNVTRLQVGPYASQAEAAKACAGINPCIAVRR